MQMYLSCPAEVASCMPERLSANCTAIEPTMRIDLYSVLPREDAPATSASAHREPSAMAVHLSAAEPLDVVPLLNTLGLRSTQEAETACQACA